MYMFLWGFPLGAYCLVVVTVVSGSGQSTLIHHGLVKQHGEGVVLVDQSAVVKSERSNLATYSGAFDAFECFFQKQTGHDKGLFNFNSTGACDQCKCIGELAVLRAPVKSRARHNYAMASA
eukprot:TRINITY_DN19292_c0_g1_i1.p1 TRINITY_DN19292_c0_g1~~TRINITY_DN19292_c0_g1_i1.p1  ORF type:complete len:121 (+),score=7.83 TRINITY_DN19292_c0_g1_i1:189-551(+)